MFSDRVIRCVLLTIAFLAWSFPAELRADWEMSKAVGKIPQSHTGRHVVKGGSPTGKYHLTSYAEAGGNKDPKGSGPKDYVAGGGNDKLESKATGKFLMAEATADIKYGKEPAPSEAGFWDSSDSSAGTFIIDLNKQGVEAAEAFATILDPATYSTEFDPDYTPELILSITFLHGLRVSVGQDPIVVEASASITGTSVSSLLVDPVWSFSWSVSSGVLPTFSFQSNPLLGLDDTSIISLFNSSAALGVGSGELLTDVTVQASLFPTVPEDHILIDQFGGEIRYNAAGRIVPEPATLLLLLPGILLPLTSRRRCRVSE